MAITNLGAVGISAGGAYNSETVYKKYKVVSANGGSYMYINPTPAAGVPVTETSHWQQIASVGGQDLVDAAVAARDAAQGYKDAAAASAAQLAAGTASPAGTYANLDALNDGTPTAPNTAKIYITLDDGNWCYHNGTAWVAGGVYQATSVSDGTITPKKLDEVYQGKIYLTNNTASIVSNIEKNGREYILRSNADIYGVAKNMASLVDVESATINGITYSVTDGVITIDGTTTHNGGNDLILPLPFPVITNADFVGKNIFVRAVFSESINTKGYISTPFNTGEQVVFVNSGLMFVRVNSVQSSFHLRLYADKTFANVTVKILAIVVDGSHPGNSIPWENGSVAILPVKTPVNLDAYDMLYTLDGTDFTISEAQDDWQRYAELKLIQNNITPKKPFNLIESHGVSSNMFGVSANYSLHSTNGKTENITVDGVSCVKVSMINTYTSDAKVFKAFQPFDFSNAKTLLLKVYLTTASLVNFNQIEVELSDADGSSVSGIIASNVKVSVMRHHVHHGWNWLKFIPSQVTPTGTPNLANIRSLRIRLYNMDGATATSIIIANNVVVGHRLKPCILVNFDDSAQSLYENGFPYMRNLGMKGTIFLCNRSLRLAYTGATVAQCMKILDHTVVKRAGWEIGMHSKSHNDVTDLESTNDFDLQYADLRYNYDSITDNILLTPTSFAAPNGKYNDYTVDALNALYVNMLRSSAININYGFAKYNGMYFVSTKEIGSTTTFETIKGFIDDAILMGGVCSIFTHQINIDNTDAYSMEFDLFKLFIDYVYGKWQAGDIEVLTFQELHDCIQHTYYQ